MVVYKKIEYKNGAGDTGFRYTKNNVLTKESRIPPEVMSKFEYATSVEYDDKPDQRRCIFCDAYQSRQRYLNQETVDLCEWHYQNKNLGSIAAQVRLLKEEKELKDGANAKSQAKRKRKQQRPSRKTKLTLDYTG